MSVPLLLYPGDPADLVLHHGDRYEIAESEHTDARRIVRRDFDGDPTSLTFAPGTATALVFRLGGRGGPVHSPFTQLHHHAIRASTRTLETPR